MANNTQKAIIEAKKSIRDVLTKALGETYVCEIVGDCDVAFYYTVKDVKRVFKLSGSFCNSKGDEPENVMCDLLDAYEAKEEARRCKERVNS